MSGRLNSIKFHGCHMLMTQLLLVGGFINMRGSHLRFNLYKAISEPEELFALYTKLFYRFSSTIYMHFGFYAGPSFLTIIFRLFNNLKCVHVTTILYMTATCRVYLFSPSFTIWNLIGFFVCF
ncbi:hypothetical protein ACJX0J_009753 [Zea mays]